jgi:diadenosine tetraphosphate (Ap4A) HIT family hydrolase
LILQPKRHVEDIGLFTLEEAADLGIVLKRTCSALTAVLAPERVYVCSFGGLVQHVHFHLIPRMGFMPSDLSADELLKEIWARKWPCTDEEAAALAAKLSMAMAAGLTSEP